MPNTSPGKTPLGLALYESMSLRYPSMCLEHQHSIRDLFLDSSATTDTAHPAIQQWLFNENDLFERVMLEPGHMVLTVFAPLFIWALNQEWSHRIQHFEALSKWTKPVDKQSESAQRLLTAVFCSGFVDAIAKMPAVYEKEVSGHAFRVMDDTFPSFLTATQHDNDHAHRASLSVAIQQGHLLALSEDFSSAPPSLNTRWQQRWTWTLKGLSPEQACGHLCALLDSSLPNTTKMLALASALGDHWCAPDVQKRLLPLLPFGEFERAEQLPWAHRNSGLFPQDTPLDLAARNETLLQTYCPKLHATLCSLVPPTDWQSPERMRSWIQTCAPIAPASLSLPPDLEASLSP